MRPASQVDEASILKLMEDQPVHWKPSWRKDPTARGVPARLELEVQSVEPPVVQQVNILLGLGEPLLMPWVGMDSEEPLIQPLRMDFGVVEAWEVPSEVPLEVP